MGSERGDFWERRDLGAPEPLPACFAQLRERSLGFFPRAGLARNVLSEGSAGVEHSRGLGAAARVGLAGGWGRFWVEGRFQVVGSLRGRGNILEGMGASWGTRPTGWDRAWGQLRGTRAAALGPAPGRAGPAP